MNGVVPMLLDHAANKAIVMIMRTNAATGTRDKTEQDQRQSVVMVMHGVSYVTAYWSVTTTYVLGVWLLGTQQRLQMSITSRLKHTAVLTTQETYNRYVRRAIERRQQTKENKMDNQHKKIKGYRDLSQAEIDLMNEVKAIGPQVQAVIEKVQKHIATQRYNCRCDANMQVLDVEEDRRLDAATPERFAAMAKTDFQTGLMYLVRAVAQPTSF